MRLMKIAVLTFVVAPTLLAQINGVSLFGHLDQPHGSGYSGCWGYTHPNGREYVLTGTFNGTSIIDITDSANVHEVAFITGPSSSWREMRTWKNYAYVVSEGGTSGTQIIDLSDLPNSATLVTSFVYTSGSNNTQKAHTIEIFDGYMYLNGCANWNPGGIVIFSLANPTQPAFQSVYMQRYIHDCYVRNDTIYGAAIYSGGGIDVIDVRNKTSPQLVGRITYTGSGTHNTWTTRDGRYVISTDEIGSTQKNLKFWDLANFPPAPPSPATTYSINPADIVHNITIRGNHAYVAWYTAGLVVVDITNPTNPQTAGSYDTYPGSSGGYNGAWAVYPYFPSGKIAISDIQTGTWIFRSNTLAPRRPVQLIEPVDNDTMVSRRSVTFRWTSAANQNDDPHYYHLRVVGGNLDTSIVVADTVYSQLTNILGLESNTTYDWYVITKDEVNATASVDTFRFVHNPEIVSVGSIPRIPDMFRLDQNYPNPFNPSTAIRYSLPVASFTSLKVYNVLGEEVATLVENDQIPGEYTVVFDAGGLSSGVYYYRLMTSTFTIVRKMLLLK